MGTAKRANGSNKRLSEHALYVEYAKQHPGEVFVILKQSRNPAARINQALRRAGITAWTRQWEMHNRKTKQLETMHSVKFGVNVDKPSSYRDGLYEAQQKQQAQQAEERKEQEAMNQLLQEKEPELVVADTLEEAVQYCRERGWKASKLAISRNDKDYPAKLAGVLNKQDVVEL